MKSTVLAVYSLVVAFAIAGCQLLTQPSDLGAPVPGNAGVLLVTNAHPTSVDLSWGKANDDKSEQKNLEYKVVYSKTDNIASIDGATANGSVAMDWTRDVGNTTITGLDQNSDYYFNVLVRDEASNEAIYVMTSHKVQQPPSTGFSAAPVPGNSGTLVISNKQSTSLTLSWAPATDDSTSRSELEYEVVQSQSDNITTVAAAQQNGTMIMNWTADTTSYDVSGLSANTTYYFNVLVRDTGGNTSAYIRAIRLGSSSSDNAPVPGNGGTLTTSNLQSTSLTLSWAEATDDNTLQSSLDYRVVMSTSDNIASASEANTNGTLVEDWTPSLSTQSISGLASGTTYYFNVLVKDGTGNIAAYLMTSATTSSSANASPVPGNGGVLTVSNLQQNSLTLSWAEATDDNTMQSNLEYRVVMSTSDNIASPSDAGTNGTLIIDWTPALASQPVSGLTAGTTYYFNVLVRDGSGNVSAYIMTQSTTSSPGTSPTPKIFWVDKDRDQVLSANLDGTHIDTLLSDYQINLDTPNYLTIDTTRKKLYMSDWGTDKIFRMNFDGSDPELIVSNPDVDGPVGIAFDNNGDRLFFLDQYTDRIQRSAPDGSLIEQVVTGVLNTGYGLTVDATDHQMFWTDWGDTLVYRASLAGTNRQTILTSADGIIRPLGITLDPQSHKIYFTDAVNQVIYRANTDGSNLEEIINTNLQFPISCAVDIKAGKLYWTDPTTQLIERSNLDGSNRETVLDMNGSLASPYAVAIWHP